MTHGLLMGLLIGTLLGGFLMPLARRSECHPPRQRVFDAVRVGYHDLPEIAAASCLHPDRAQIQLDELVRYGLVITHPDGARGEDGQCAPCFYLPGDT